MSTLRAFVELSQEPKQSQYPGLHDVFREGDPDADTLRQPVDFYSPDTFNYDSER